MPAAALLRAGANDACWHQPADANAAFLPVRQALAACRSSGDLASAVASCRTPAEFRRWMKRSLAQAGSEELPLLSAYLRYFETLAGSH